MAKRLHEALETYPLPKAMRRWDVRDENRAKLNPIFRDVAELTAHHSLSEKIRDAVKTSRFLILLCSPAAKKSFWVNEEIKLFRKLHGEAAILAVIVDGKPDTAFPPALTEDGREPLAADMTSKEGFKFGVTQLAASMLGVGLDQLVQRDQRRRRLRTQLVSGVSSAIAVAMGALAWTAIDARDDARDALDEALTARNASEGMVEFMIKDFKEQLVPLQKLDLFDSVGQRVKDYYDDIPIEDMDDDRLMRKTRSLHVLGEVELAKKNHNNAEKIFSQAHSLSNDVLIRNPENIRAIFTHAQSEYWVGWTKYKQRDFIGSIPWLENYRDLSQQLFNSDKTNFDWVMEAGGSNNTLALALMRTGDLDKTRRAYKKTSHYLTIASKLKPDNVTVKRQQANLLSGIAQFEGKAGNKVQELHYRRLSAEKYRQISNENPNNLDLRFRYLQANYLHLRVKGEKLCRNPKFEQSFNDILELRKYDKENIDWASLFFVQWKNLILECDSENAEILKIFSRSRFLSETKPYLSDPFIKCQVDYVNGKRDRGSKTPCPN